MGLLIYQSLYKLQMQHCLHCRYESEASAEVGYKLAFNFLKAEKYMEAIDVCNKVLYQYPDFPRLQEDILNKAIGGLRP